jgi:IS605 OrfB family transposase
MAHLALTLKLPFYRLNQIKALEFERLTALNTHVANELLLREKKERSKLTSAAFHHVEISSNWINQTIRNANARKKAKYFRRMWLETNNQSYELAKHVDRGQNNIAVAALPKSFGKFWSGLSVKALRRKFQKTRIALQQTKKLKKIKQIESKERRLMTQINHEISKELVRFAKDFQMGLRFEDLTGCRQTMKQRKKTKSGAAKNRDNWAFYQLETFTRYKAIRAGVPVESIPAPYTSKSDHRNGVIGKREKHQFTGFDGYRCNADWNASQNIGQWLGFACPLELQKVISVMDVNVLGDGVDDSPLTSDASKTVVSTPS